MMQNELPGRPAVLARVGSELCTASNKALHRLDALSAETATDTPSCIKSLCWQSVYTT